MKKCQHCNVSNPDNQQFCMNCSAEFVEVDEGQQDARRGSTPATDITLVGEPTPRTQHGFSGMEGTQDVAVSDEPEIKRSLQDQGNLDPIYCPGKLKLVLRSGKFPQMEYLLDQQIITIGRHDHNDGIYPEIDFFDQEEEGAWTISREHAHLIFRDGRLFVKDLRSGNGTFINSPSPISAQQEIEVRLGDKIAFGPNIVTKLEEYNPQ